MQGRLFKDIAPEFLAHYLLYSEDRRTMPFQMRVLERHFAELPLEGIGVPQVEGFMAARLTEGVTRATINRQRAALSVLMEWAIARGYRPAPNPVRSVKKFREGMGRTRYLTGDEAGRLLLAAAPHLKVFIMLGLHTGGRRGELLALRWEDVDLEAGSVTFERESTKGKKTRHIPLSEPLGAFLRPLRGRPHEPVCLYERRPLRDVKTAFDHARVKAGLGPDVTAHVLRHSFASWFVLNGGDLYRLKELLGHTDVKLTMRYAHLSPQFVADGVRFIGPPRRRDAEQDRG